MLILGVCFILYYLKLSGTNGLRNTISFDRLLMLFRNRMGPKVDPCGTPEKILIKLKNAICLLYFF